MIPEKLRRG